MAITTVFPVLARTAAAVIAVRSIATPIPIAPLTADDGVLAERAVIQYQGAPVVDTAAYGVAARIPGGAVITLDVPAADRQVLQGQAAIRGHVEDAEVVPGMEVTLDRGPVALDGDVAGDGG